MHDTTPLVSIIVPIYNVQAYLKECLESIINQTYTNIDIVLINDGSTDESLQIAQEYARKDNRIFLVSIPNFGLSNARNTGLEFIKNTPLRDFFENGQKTDIPSFSKTNTFQTTQSFIAVNELEQNFEQVTPNFIKSKIQNINELLIQELPKRLIHFVDSDDYLHSQCIAECVKLIREQKLEICVHNLAIYNEKNKQFTYNQRLGVFKNVPKDSYESGLELLAQNKLYDFYFAWQGCFDSQILNRYKLRFTPRIYHEDHDFGTLLFVLAQRVGYTNQALYIYRGHAYSISSSQYHKDFPPNLPDNLKALQPFFDNYKDLRIYFKAYCYCIIASKIWEFYQENAKQDKQWTQNYKDFFTQTTLSCLQIFKTSLKIDPLKIKDKLAIFTIPKPTILRWFVNDLHRQPKKIRYIHNLKFLLFDNC
ncbi:MAG: glycosyltransferase [Helicobacter sp.]|nr:glycosyltransferase [Helicobacter sp.]MDY5740982.1 glycosyltransferase [Helicobacter sp.]